MVLSKPILGWESLALIGGHVGLFGLMLCVGHLYLCSQGHPKEKEGFSNIKPNFLLPQKKNLFTSNNAYNHTKDLQKTIER